MEEWNPLRQMPRFVVRIVKNGSDSSSLFDHHRENHTFVCSTKSIHKKHYQSNQIHIRKKKVEKDEKTKRWIHERENMR